MVEGGAIRREGDYALIRIPMSDVHKLRVCLHPCKCVAPKSTSTLEYAERLDKGLARREANK